MDQPRTIPQNNALHLYFQMVADALNDAGYDVRHVVKPDIDIPWTKELVKNHLWRPVQKLAFEKESTTELLKQKEIDKIWEILATPGMLDKYDPTVKKSTLISNEKTGLGAKRKVDMLDGKNWFWLLKVAPL